MSEAREINGKISLSSWFRASLLGFAGFVIFCFSFLANHVIANDKIYIRKMNDNEKNLIALSTKFGDIKEDIGEIKSMLRKDRRDDLKEIKSMLRNNDRINRRDIE